MSVNDSTLSFLKRIASVDMEAAWSIIDEMTADELTALSEELAGDGGGPQTDNDFLSGGPADLAEAYDSKFRTPAHVRLLSEAIKQTVEEAQDGSGNGRLIVSMPPRAGKSYTSSMWAPVWFLARYPDRNIILASHEGNFAVSWGRKSRDLYRRLSMAGMIKHGVSGEVSSAG